MADPLQALCDEPAILEFLGRLELTKFFTPLAIQRAAAYTAPGVITRIKIKFLIPNAGDGDDFPDDEEKPEMTIIAKVAGSRRRPYSTEVILLTGFDDEWDIETYCDCTVGSSCKHAAALLMRLMETARGQLRAGILPKKINQWLREVETTVEASSAKQAGKRPAAEKFLAYCFHPGERGGPGEFLFSSHPATRLKCGIVRIEMTEARADPFKPTSFMCEEDVPVCIAYQRHPRSRVSYGTGVFPQGELGAKLIELALATGRFYFVPDGRLGFGNDRYRLLAAGDAIKVDLLWETLPTGNARPVIGGLPDGCDLLPVDPPMYFDRAAAVIGALISDQPVKLVHLWREGPEMSAAVADQVSSRFGSLPGKPLPAPVAFPVETRPPCEPVPHFSVRRVRSTLSGLEQDFIVGHLSFQYDNSTPFPHEPGGPPTEYGEVRDGKRIVWPRDVQAERELALWLEIAGIVPFTEVISEFHLGHAIRHGFVPADPQPSQTVAWLRCLDSEGMAQLRRQGWIVTVDPNAGLTVQEVTAFLPAIEPETDHGIDWFRFDVAVEIGGNKRSLIPFIARAIDRDFPPATAPDLPEYYVISCDNPEDGFVRLPARRFLEIVDQVRHLFHGRDPAAGPLKIDRLEAAHMADSMRLGADATTRALAELGRTLKDIRGLPAEKVPSSVQAKLRPYQTDGFRWLRFLAHHQLHGILADDMGLGKTLQTLTHLAAQHGENPGAPSLVVAPTSVVPNWAAEAARFTPHLKTLILQGPARLDSFSKISAADIVITSYPLLYRDQDALRKIRWHCVVLDEAQHIKNPRSATAHAACALQAAHRLCLSGTPIENHLGELWSLMRFLMPGFLPDEKTFNSRIRKPIERDRSGDAQAALNRRVAPLILRRTKDQVAADLPPKTEIIHHVDLTAKQVELYESVRATMDKRVRDAITAKGLAGSQIIVLDALLKLRQICCHPRLLRSTVPHRVSESAKLSFLTDELLPQLIEEGRRILLFSQFTSMLEIIETYLAKEEITYLKLTGQTKERAALVERFQTGEVPVFLISLKAGGTGLNLTAADTVIHYDPWWNPAAENQATDRAHRIGQNKPVFVHKLVCRGSIEDRILELQKHKASLVKALLSEETTSLRIDSETLSQLLAPMNSRDD